MEGFSRAHGAGAWFLCCLVFFTGISEAQISFENASSAAPFGSNDTWGAAWGHLDSDPYPELFVSNHRSIPPQIFKNNGDGTFSDVTTLVDVEGHWAANPTADTHSGTWADFDNDGDQDLIIPLGGGSNTSQFFVNDNGVLRERAASYGFQAQASARTGIWFDYDGDTLLDVLMTSRVDTTLMRNNGTTFSDVTAAANMDCDKSSYAFLTDVRPTGGTVDDGRMELICAWQNNFPVNAYEIPEFPSPGLPFIDITAAVSAMFPGASINKDDAIFDFNGDLIPDVYAARGGKMRPSDAKNDGANGIEAYFNSSPRQTVEFNTTGMVTFTVGTSLGNLSEIFIGQSGFHPAAFEFTLDPTDPLVEGIQPHGSNVNGIYIGYDSATNQWTFEQKGYLTHLNVMSTDAVTGLTFIGKVSGDNPTAPKLYLSSPSGHQEQAAASGLNENLACITATGGDFDNDGDVDLYLGCRGGVENLPNRLYENQGDGTFVEVANAGGAAGIVGLKVADGAGTTDSVITADYDVDGHLDLFIANGLALQPKGVGGPYQLFRNLGDPNNHWIQLDLVGVNSNRDAIGARVIATTATLPPQLRERNGGYHRWSQNHNRVHFGLGDNSVVDLEVLWPSGVTEFYNNVAADGLYRITEGGTIEAIIGGAPGEPLASVADVNVDETAAVATLTISLSSPANGSSVFVDYTTSDGSATAGSDYTTTSGTAEIVDGMSSTTFDVPLLDDDLIEGDETFTVTLSNPQGAQLADPTASVTILDDDAVSACGEPAYNRATEKGLFLWRDCDAPGPDAEWHLRVTGGGSSTSISYGGIVDSAATLTAIGYSLESNDILDSTPGDGSVDYLLHVVGGGQDGFQLNIPGSAETCFDPSQMPAGANVYVGAERHVVTGSFSLTTLAACVDSLSVADLSVSENDASGVATMTISLSAPVSGASVFVDYATADVTATAGSDYTATSGTAEIVDGTSSTTFDIPLLDDGLVEGAETLTVTLSNPQGAPLGQSVATVTIIDDESLTCGEPSYSRGSEQGLFLWRNCEASGPGTEWHVRATGGGSPTLIVYAGLASAVPTGTVLTATGHKLESSDVLDSVPGDNEVDFQLQMLNAGEDGFQLDVPANADVCFSADTLPSGANIYVGSDRQMITTSAFDLATLAPCTP